MQLERKRDQILRICRRHGVRAIWVFGSVARQEHDARSDVDFLVELEPDRTLLDLAALKRELETLLGRPVDVLTPASLRAPMKERVWKEARPL